MSTITYAVLSSLSFSRVANHPSISRAVTAAGAVLLACLAALCFRAAWHDLQTDPIAQNALLSPEPSGAIGATDQKIRRAPASDYLTGLLMTLFNPMTLLFWFTGVPAVAASVGPDHGQIPQAAGGGLPMICTGVFIGTISWVVCFAGLLTLAGARSRRRTRWLALADAAGGVAMLAFAVLDLLRLVRPFL